MKKKIVIFIAIVIVICCVISFFIKNESIEKKLEDATEDVTEGTGIVPEEPKYTDDNPMKIGFYEYNHVEMTLQTEINAILEINKDIGTFCVVPSQESKVKGAVYVQDVFNEHWKQYPDYENNKIGYNLKFTTRDESVINKTILDPSTASSTSPYILTFLYDAVHSTKGVRYSHVTPESYNSDTLLTSIKLYNISSPGDIISPIELTVFTYNGPDDFDEDGHYRGNSFHTIKINISYK